MIDPSKYLLSARDPETYVALAVDDLLSRAGGAALHAQGELTREYLGMLSLYAIRQASMMFTEGMPYYRLIRHTCDTFNPDNMSDRLIACLTDILSSVNAATVEPDEPVPSFEGLHLSGSVESCLAAAGVYSVSDLLKLNRNELNKIRALGDIVTDELAAALYRQGYRSRAVDLAFPGSTVREIEKARIDPDSVLYLELKTWLGNRLYRNGVKTLSRLKQLSVDELAELDGISYDDIMEINAAVERLSLSQEKG